MLSLSPSFDDGPRTPSSSSTYRPHTSSPLSESFSPSPSTSAAAKLQSRRLAQYKSTTTPTRRVSSAYQSRPNHGASDEPNFSVRLFHSAAPLGDVEDNTRNALLRDRLRKRCAHRAQQAHSKRVERDRRRHGLSSDGEDMGMESDEEEDGEEVVLNDELFRRIIASAKHKQQHSYRLSFQDEVGSSIDPDMEDVAEWERTLQDAWPLPPLVSVLPRSPDLPPSEFDEEEIAERAAQAEEAELWADLDGADVTLNSSDIIDLAPKTQAILDEDVDMA